MIKAALIPADETKPVEFIETNGLVDYQRIVDGNIEAVRLRDNEYSVAMDFYCNDEFLFREDLEVNGRASLLYTLSFNATGYIKGDVVVIGGVDQNGNDKGLNEAQVTHLKAFDEMFR